MLEGLPVIVLEQGRALDERLQREGITEGEILGAAREAHGLERMDQIKYAVVEQNGRITIVPRGAE